MHSMLIIFAFNNIFIEGDQSDDFRKNTGSGSRLFKKDLNYSERVLRTRTNSTSNLTFSAYLVRLQFSLFAQVIQGVSYPSVCLYGYSKRCDRFKYVFLVREVHHYLGSTHGAARRGCRRVYICPCYYLLLLLLLLLLSYMPNMLKGYTIGNRGGSWRRWGVRYFGIDTCAAS